MQYRTAHEAHKRIRAQNSSTKKIYSSDFDYSRRKIIDCFYMDKNFSVRKIKYTFLFGFHIEYSYINHYQLIGSQLMDFRRKIKATYILVCYMCVLTILVLLFIVYMTLIN